MRPRTMVEVVGIGGPEERRVVRIGLGEDLVLEGWVVRVPAREEWSWEAWMCVPGPGLLDEEEPSAWPGRAKVDMVVV